MTTTLPVKKGSSAVNTKTPADAERSKILAEANEDFIEMYNKIRDKFIAEELTIFESRYEIGRMIDEMKKNEIDYGSKCVERMQTLIGFDRSIIYMSWLFYEKYSENEMKELVSLRNKNGEPLTWTHITYLIRVQDKDVREQLQQTCLDNNWSPADLTSYIQMRKGGAKQSNGGKPMARPKSINGFIEQQQTALDQLLRRKDKVWAGAEKPGDQSFFDTLRTVPLEKIDADLVTDLSILQSKYEEASLELANMATDIKKARIRLEQAKQRNKTEIDDEEGEDEEPEEKAAKSKPVKADVVKLLAKPKKTPKPLHPVIE